MPGLAPCPRQEGQREVAQEAGVNRGEPTSAGAHVHRNRGDCRPGKHGLCPLLELLEQERSSSFQTRDTSPPRTATRLHDSLMQRVDTVGHPAVERPDRHHT